MVIKKVRSQKDAFDFLHVPVRFYKKEKHWIRPLDKDIESVFDDKINRSFRHGSCERWLLLDEQGCAIGRVAAFVNHKTVDQGNDQPTGGMGFFECINNQEAAFLLFDECKKWLISKGMEAMDGPINFGDRDRWWGLLVDGFDFDPNYQCNYNFPYYRDLFEMYGFKVYFKQFTFLRAMLTPLSEKMIQRAQKIMDNPDYSFRCLKKTELGKLADYIRIVYNGAWASRVESPPLSPQQANRIVKQMRPIIDVNLLQFGFYKGEPVSCFISIPEINQIFKHVNGKLNVLGKLKFLVHSLFKTNRKALGVLFGIVPQHQGKGLDGAMVLSARDVLWYKHKRYDVYELNWIGDFNPRMIAIVKQVGSRVIKTHHTYRKLFDETKTFKRYPILH